MQAVNIPYLIKTWTKMSFKYHREENEETRKLKFKKAI